ncbi:hypothetical protein KGF56_001792 [Candida oxycetoniae]|uniref:Pre-mRNA-splicing factor 38 n=1 Tax=Candida oxycetoniae TaxID=497107 RepID=A0AAI9WYI2_9ASCO|nr:uncharacterized protein KGF56_001792 [Candida oxycetoniae]KAI3405396.1 hypothetical protein KGF56_001792 [Candida oxycetoniae]
MPFEETKKTSVYYKKQASYHDKRTTTNLSHLIEPIIRHRILDSIFYKQYLYLTNEATILTVITEQVKYVGGVDSIGRPSPFLQSLFRMLELAPSKEIIDVYLHQLKFNEFKYLVVLTLLYIRLTFTSEEIYTIFDKFSQDFRKLKFKLKNSHFDSRRLPIFYKIIYMDEFIDDLLIKDRVVDLTLPRLIPRLLLVERGLVAPRQYFLDKETRSETVIGQRVSPHQEDDNNSDIYESDSD